MHENTLDGFQDLSLYLSHVTDVFVMGNRMHVGPGFFCANTICKEMGMSCLGFVQVYWHDAVWLVFQKTP